MLNQTMMNLSATFSQYHQDIQQWGAIKAETGKFEAELKWGTYIQLLLGDQKHAANMTTQFALRLADWLSIWVARKLPEAKCIPPESLIKQDSALPRYLPVKLASIVEWAKYEISDLQRRGMI